MNATSLSSAASPANSDPSTALQRRMVAVPDDLFHRQRLAKVSRGGPPVLDLFAGAGGFSLGFEAAGFHVRSAVEVDAWACETLADNHPNTDVIKDDISSMSNAELAAAMTDVRVVIGGPPCQGFSVSNNGADPGDPRNSLFRDFVRAASLGTPEVLLLENVPGLLRRTTAEGEPVIDVICSEFERIGFTPHVAVLQAVDFGVPQLRPRLFVLGLQNETESPFPMVTHAIDVSTNGQLDLLGTSTTLDLIGAVTVWDAVGDLPSMAAREGSECMPYSTEWRNEYQRLLRADSTEIFNHKAMRHSARIVERFASLSWGDSGGDAPEHLRSQRRNGGGELSHSDYGQNNRRMHPNKPSHTLPASFYANFVHPYDDRNFTPREGARLQSFPDWYRFSGKPTVVSRKLLAREDRHTENHLCQYNQIGNAVPPLLAYQLAVHIRHLLGAKES
jgi:DNA (cytosine-5)-methyltransferase 1